MFLLRIKKGYISLIKLLTQFGIHFWRKRTKLCSSVFINKKNQTQTTRSAKNEFVFGNLEAKQQGKYTVRISNHFFVHFDASLQDVFLRPIFL